LQRLGITQIDLATTLAALLTTSRLAWRLRLRQRRVLLRLLSGILLCPLVVHGPTAIVGDDALLTILITHNRLLLVVAAQAAAMFGC
jgi:hypothetical protein